MINFRQHQINFLFSITGKIVHCTMHLSHFIFGKESWYMNFFFFVSSNCHDNTSFMKEFRKKEVLSTMMFCNAISVKLVVGTYMGRATPGHNEKNILEVPLELSFYRIPSWVGSWKVDNIQPSFWQEKFCSKFCSLLQILFKMF